MSKRFRIVLDGVIHEAEVDEIGTVREAGTVSSAPVKTLAPVPAAATAPAPKAGMRGDGEVVSAPLQGKILSVDVTVGQSVKSGQNLLIIEAMKMENEVVAPRDCVVKEICVTAGASVAAGEPLVKIS